MNNVDFSRIGRRVIETFWDSPIKNDDSSPIWCLGKCYESKPHQRPGAPLSASHGSSTSSAKEDTRSRASSDADSQVKVNKDECPPAENEGNWPPPFLDDFDARIWLSYRYDFPPIPKSQDPKAVNGMSWSVRLKNLGNQEGFTSDTGWGCMIRSGQSLLANTLLFLQLGRDWRRGSGQDQERHILSLFADDPKAPFSIHRFVEHGATACGKHPGQWFGPSAAARCIQALSSDYSQSGLRVYLTGDGSDVYEDSFMKIAKSSDGTFNPTLVLVGIRLGIDRVTPVYWEALKASLQMPQSVGIAGGQPSSSHYFVGVQGSYLFYLDPHTTQICLPHHSDISQYTPEQIGTCHTRRLRRIHVSEMDPSMLIAFLIRDEDDWHSWRRGMSEVQGKPIIHIADREPASHRANEREGAIDEVETFDDEDDEGEGLLVSKSDVALQ